MFKQGAKCPHCNVDSVLYNGTVRLSDRLHNQGLERLKNGDLFHGINVLTKSVSINKNNVPARNMLGLALFEVGHVGEALKHWVISQSMMKDDNPAEKYIENAHKNARQLEKLNDAVEMFNQALGHIKQKSDDLAIIQLKKAVEINPRFIDALNLLTLCYLIQNDRDRASATAERVISMDIFNPVALNYYSILNPGKRVPRQQPRTKNPPPQNGKAPYKSIGLEEKKPRSFHLAELFTFLIGVGCTVAACYFLLIPGIERSRETERTQAAELLNETSASYRQQLEELSSANENLSQEISGFRANVIELAAELDVQRRVNHVNNAYSDFGAIESANTAENLDELRRIVGSFEDFDRTDLPHDILSRIDAITDGAYPRLGVHYFGEGRTAFAANPRDSYMALAHLRNAQRYLNEDSAEWNRLLFMLGTLYYDEENFDDAHEALSELHERIPGLPAGAPGNFTGGERQLFNNMITSLEARRL
jgi:tetratricopeptide (TPR) repeat protein